mgnify:FL=1|jgi:hypothetical protein|tara:strand:+ start:2785 stop:3051 length:267 start_codon:yes stop_codon:yes gene_type:complete
MTDQLRTYWVNVFEAGATTMHYNEEDAIQEVLDYGCSRYVETVKRVVADDYNDTIIAYSILPAVREVISDRRETVRHEAAESMSRIFV